MFPLINSIRSDVSVALCLPLARTDAVIALHSV